MSIDLQTLRDGLSRTLNATDFAELGTRYQGKVRDNYTTGDGRRFIIVTDRISAFDRVLGTLPFKGQVLNQIAAWWFEQSRHVAPNHLRSVPDPNVMEVTECRPLPVEMIVRGYLTGSSPTSIWTCYSKGGREFCGHRLPEGLKKHQPLPEPILTPTTKAAHGEHDQNASRQQLIDGGVITSQDFDAAAEYAKALFAFGQKVCAQRGLILVDTKYELGKTADGTLVVIDEIHTPDSSRYWFADSYEERLAAGQEPEAFDKEYVRRWLGDQGYAGDGPAPTLPDAVRVEAARRYIEACNAVRGAPFTPDTEPPEARIRRNLGLARGKGATS